MDEKRIEIWEDQREIKNLMGRYTRALLHKEEGTILERFWSRREDVSLGRNQGWYLGRDSIGDYYGLMARKMEQTDRMVKARFRGLPEVQAAKGIGYLPMYALSSDLVEVAADGATAKGMWAVSGQDTEFTAAGPVTKLLFGTLAVDFVREDGAFRILNMLYFEEICHPQGEKWWEAEKVRQPLPEFSDLKEMQLEPDVQVGLYAKWAPGRGVGQGPVPPEPYDTFANTFSYGYTGEVEA